VIPYRVTDDEPKPRKTARPYVVTDDAPYRVADDEPPLKDLARPVWGMPGWRDAAPRDVTVTPPVTPPAPTRTVGALGPVRRKNPATTFETIRDIATGQSDMGPLAETALDLSPVGFSRMGAMASEQAHKGDYGQAALTTGLALSPLAIPKATQLARGLRSAGKKAPRKPITIEMIDRDEFIRRDVAEGVKKSQQALEDAAEPFVKRPSMQPPLEVDAGALPERTASTMSDAIALSSPSGSMSKTARRAANERLRVALFGESGLQQAPVPQPAEKQRLLQQARELRDLASRGMKTKAYNRKAEELEAQAAALLSGTAFSNPIGPALKYAATSRAGSSTAMAATGYGLQQSEDEKLSATGTGLMLLAGIHAVGLPRIRSAGKMVGNEVVQGLRHSPTGQRALNLISHDILADPQVKSLVHTYEQGVAMGRARAAEFSKQAKALGPQGDRQVSDLIEREAFEPLTTDQTVALGVAQKISDEFTALGKAKVNAGLLSAETVAKREGKYLPRMYAEHLGDQAATGTPRTMAGGKKIRIVGDKSRLDLSDVIRNELGEVREASFRTAYGLEKGYRDVASVKLFAALREIPDVVHPEFAQASDALAAAIQTGDAAAIKQAKQQVAGFSAHFKDGTDGFRKLPDTPGMGVLRGAVVRADVADYLNGVPDLGGRAGSLLNLWKKVHTVLNPGTHVGNTASNSVVAHMIGLPVWEQPNAIRNALKDWSAYGPATRTLTEAGILSHGLPTMTQAVPLGGRPVKQALTELAATTRPETAKVLAEKGIKPQGMLRRLAGRAAEKMTAAYSKEDGIFRVAVYQKLTGQGMPGEQAAKLVDEAFVNYRTRSPLLGAIKNTVSPFIMYPVKAIPFVTGQIIEHPWRWATLAAMWGGLDQYSRKQVGAIAEADLRPSQRTNKYLGYLEPGMTQLPFTNERGDKYGTDLARWTPFSALTGSPAPGSTAFAALGERVPGILQPSGPFVDIGARLTNTDPFTGDKLIKPGADWREKAGVGAKSAAALTLPSALSFHAPRVLDNLVNADPKAASINALGLVGARPQVVRPGMQQWREQKDYEDARNQIIADLRRALRASKSERHSQALEARARSRLESLANKYQAEIAQR